MDWIEIERGEVFYRPNKITSWIHVSSSNSRIPSVQPDTRSWSLHFPFRILFIRLLGVGWEPQLSAFQWIASISHTLHALQSLNWMWITCGHHALCFSSSSFFPSFLPSPPTPPSPSTCWDLLYVIFMVCGRLLILLHRFNKRSSGGSPTLTVDQDFRLFMVDHLNLLFTSCSYGAATAKKKKKDTHRRENLPLINLIIFYQRSSGGCADLLSFHWTIFWLIELFYYLANKNITFFGQLWTSVMRPPVKCFYPVSLPGAAGLKQSNQVGCGNI